MRLKLIAVGLLIGAVAALTANSGESSDYSPSTPSYTSGVKSGVSPDGTSYSYEVGNNTYDPYAPGYDPSLHGNNELGPACGIFTSC